MINGSHITPADHQSIPPTAPIPFHTATIDGDDHSTFGSTGILTGTVSVDGGAPRLCVTLYGKTPYLLAPIAMVQLLDVEGARGVAASLNAIADEIEAKARDEARAALERAQRASRR